MRINYLQTSEFKDQLFACAGVSPDLLHEFSCGKQYT